MFVEAIEELDVTWMASRVNFWVNWRFDCQCGQGIMSTLGVKVGEDMDDVLWL